MNVRTLLVVLLVVLTTLGAASAQDVSRPGEGVTVEPAVATWMDAQPLEAIYHVLLEELGYDVREPRALSNPIFYQTVTQGDVDYWTNGSFPLHYAQLPDDFEEHASIVGTAIENGVLQGYLVSKEAAEEYGITSLEDFERPEVKEAFDADGDGRADMVGCPAGWGCHVMINHHLDAYELRDHINATEAAYGAAFADALARHRNGEPILFHTWTPNFTVRELVPGEDVVWINVPEIIPTEDQEGLEDAMVVEGLEGAVTDPVRMGFVVNDTQVVANDAFLEENPAARTLFELAEVPREDISDMTARMTEGEDSREAVTAMAEAWVEANRDTVDGWLQQAREAAAP